MELKIEELSRSYGEKKALDKVNIRFGPGVYGLLGPNGAGKSTLMNIIAGNLSADHGQITYDGTDIRTMGKEFRDILGFMPQQSGFYDGFTGRRFLAYMAALKGMSKSAAAVAIERAAAYVNLTDVLHKRLESYSGGMKQRLMIAQAILNEPEVLILDEPTAGLDPQERIRVRNMISEIARDNIVILATHVVSDIEYIGREVVLLKKGRVLRQDTPQHILEELSGKVFELEVTPDQVKEVEQRFMVSNLTSSGSGITVRIVTDSRPDGYPYREVAPTLEEEYLYAFAEEII